MTIKNKNDGHLSSAMCQAIIEDTSDILRQLDGMDDCTLPTWWTSKLAVASAYLNSLRDYVIYNMDDIMEEAAEVEDDEEDASIIEEPIEDSSNIDIEEETASSMTDMADEMLPPSARMMKNAAKAG